MLFLELPLDVLLVIFERCVVEWRLQHATRARLVNKFFDREIRRAICTKRHMLLDHVKASFPSVNRELEQEFLEHLVRIGNPDGVALASVIQEAISGLDSENGAASADELARRRTVLCKACLTSPPAPYDGGRTFLKVGPVTKALLRDGRRTVENNLLVAAILCGELASHPHLLAHSSHLSACNVFFGTPLACAAATGSVDTVKLLLNKGAVDSPSFPSAIATAAYRGHFEIVQALLDADVDGSIYERTPHTFSIIFSHAVRGGHLSTIQKLLDSSLATDDAATMENCTDAAASGASEDVVRFLVTNVKGCLVEARPDGYRKHRVRALSTCNPRITELLLGAFTFSDRTIWEAGCAAARKGHLKSFECIYKMEPNKCFSSQCPASFWPKNYLRAAASAGELEVVSYILKVFEPPAEVVWSPMTSAASRGMDSAVRLLYNYGSKTEDWCSIARELLHCLFQSFANNARNHDRHLNVEHTLTELYNNARRHAGTDPEKMIQDLVLVRKGRKGGLEAVDNQAISALTHTLCVIPSQSPQKLQSLS